LLQAALNAEMSHHLGYSKNDNAGDFKAGFEEAIKERRELVEWLENGYFG
jgi:transposase-like protein